jgi:hypothetical protein
MIAEATSEDILDALIMCLYGTRESSSSVSEGLPADGYIQISISIAKQRWRRINACSAEMAGDANIQGLYRGWLATNSDGRLVLTAVGQERARALESQGSSGFGSCAIC